MLTIHANLCVLWHVLLSASGVVVSLSPIYTRAAPLHRARCGHLAHWWLGNIAILKAEFLELCLCMCNITSWSVCDFICLVICFWFEFKAHEQFYDYKVHFISFSISLCVVLIRVQMDIDIAYHKHILWLRNSSWRPALQAWEDYHQCFLTLFRYQCPEMTVLRTGQTLLSFKFGPPSWNFIFA